MSEISPLVEAQDLFLKAVPSHQMPAEQVAIEKAWQRTLHADLLAPEDAPPYHRAIVEGFLVNTAETGNASEESPISFKVVGSVAPGDAQCPSFGPGEAIEVQTGSILPDGNVSIVRMWEAKRDGDSVSISRPFPPRFFIEDQGCDIKKADTVISAGTVLTPQHIGTIASFGQGEVAVARQPRVTVFASGDEVIPYTAPFKPGMIRDCNSPMLEAAVSAAGGLPTLGGIMGDNFDNFVSAIKNTLEHADMIVISGGTAVGGRDFISDLISEVGELLVDGVPMRSGRPLIMGIANGKPIVAVAGHPPEALRGFQLFGAPAISKLMGQNNPLPEDEKQG
ncbi:MAG TPA: molybdopterin molybdenumtransferase MoeA [Candidatus Tenderia electrophaga]|uniref:Molybdopterin molybdenumtransferase n=1 Tax=Candidatus Tenderia electrophaga TaxID=1748243 RepID=A0A832N5N0_9GAMM|nr:molybdopterin molybdenumtransferase MoeA [Candidatus Tenderia electrophaga]